MPTEEGVEVEMIRLLTSDGQEFEVAERVAFVSPTIKRLMEEGLGDRRIALPNIDSKIMQKVLEFAEYRATTPFDPDADHEEDGVLDKELMHMDPASITCLILAANYLKMDELLHLACRRAAELMAGQTGEAVQKMFHLKSQVTPEEEAQIKKNHKWAFE